MTDFSLPLRKVKAFRDAQYAYCPSCGRFLGCQYWTLNKSVAMHERGTGHKPTLYAICDLVDKATVTLTVDHLDRAILTEVSPA
jgi:hypothetical protein